MLGASRENGWGHMLSVLMRKISSAKIRARRAVIRARVAAACNLLGAENFEFWGQFSDAEHKPMPPLGDIWLARGRLQFEFLRQVGLRPQNSFLDYGCAYLATAYYVIPYLEPHRYVGVDVAKYSVLRGVARLAEAGIPRERYQIATAASPLLPELTGFSFDFIFSFSAIQYTTDREFPVLIRRLGSLLNPGGRFCFDFEEAPSHELTSKGMYFHSLEDYREHLPLFSLERRGQFALLQKP